MIKTLIIMTTYGQIFYSKQGFFGADVGDSDISLTAGLISAIYSMTSETQEQKITELELEQDRSVFREMPGEKLFIITVDKRMDTSDADDLLTEMVYRFDKKYGDIVMDGMILSDFEPIVDEIIEEKLWYNTVDKNVALKDFGALLALIFGAIFYSFMFLDGQAQFVNPVKDALEEGVGQLLISLVILGLMVAIPISLITILVSKYSKLNEAFKFSKEFLRRPTRGGYAELLPNWFLLFPIFSISLFMASVRFGRGMQFSLTIRAIPSALEGTIRSKNGTDVLWLFIYIFLVLVLLTWFILLPTIVGIFTGELNWKFMKSSWMIIGMSLLVLVPAQIIAGISYQTAIGYHPENEVVYTDESENIIFLFKVTFLANFFLFLFIFLIGIGMSQLIKKNKGRFTAGFGLGLFTTLAIQNILLFFIFNSEYFFPGKTFT